MTQNRGRHDVNPTAEQVAQLLTQPRHPQQVIASAGNQINQHVNVTPGVRLTTSHRPEQARVDRAIAAKNLIDAELGKRRSDDLAHRYREWLTAA